MMEAVFTRGLMSAFRAGSLRLFQLFGIGVYIHWSWLLVALFQVQYRAQVAQDGNTWLPLYDSGRWYWFEYLALFGIVLLHEFGHALACRSVGGLANHIVLWPLGGIAFSRPPQRPGPVLWTVAAGPLVNVLLAPVLGALWFFSEHGHWAAVNVDLPEFLKTVFILNAGLLGFNLVPIFPLDGGRILHALLWFIIGQADSLMFVSVIGMIGGGLFFLLSLVELSPLLAVMAAFVILSAYAGFRQGQMLSRLLSQPRRREAVCPSCGTSPLVGSYWTCDECRTRFDLFRNRGQCPGCGKLFSVTQCPECFQEHGIGKWFVAPAREGSPHYVPR
jgi:Zn-dependent protease